MQHCVTRRVRPPSSKQDVVCEAYPRIGTGPNTVIAKDMNITIIIHPHSGWYFSFGHSPNITGDAQVRFQIGLPAMHLLRKPAQAGLNPSLPCVKGGGTACRDGGIVKSHNVHKTSPQSASLTAPFTQVSL